MQSMTNAQYRKALKDHAEALWALADAARLLDAKFSAQLRQQANVAYDLHFEYCRIETRHGGDMLRQSLKHAEQALQHVASPAVRNKY